MSGANGGGVTWHAPVVTTEGMLTNPGDRDYTLINIPSELLGGKYVGSPTWPSGSSWTWTILVNAPTKLYVWIQDSYDAGISSTPDGWTREAADRPDRSDNSNGKLYSKWVTDSVQLSASGLLVGGAFKEPCSPGNVCACTHV